MRFGACTVALAVLAGCQTYARKPLDSQAHRSAWAARSVDDENMGQYAARLGLALPPSSSLAPGEEVTLAAAEVVALAYNADLRSARARAAVALASAENAGLWDDPAVSLDALRIVESVPEPWVIGGAVGFTIPLSGRLRVEKARAAAEHALALARVSEQEWSTVTALRSKWVEWSEARLRADLLRDLLARVDAIVEIVDRLEEARALSRLEGRLFRLERASRQSEWALTVARADQLELDLKSLMGVAPEAPITLRAQLATPPVDPDTDLFMILEERSPALAVRRAAYEVAEDALHLEIRKQHLDLQIGPAAEWEEGQNRIGLGAGLVLPLLNANRQGIATARAEREAARIEYESLHEQLVSACRRARRQHEAAAAAREAIERDLLPLAEAQIADERRLADLGELNVLLSLESIVRAHETKVQLIEARVAEAQAAVRLQDLLGPPTSASTKETQP